MRKKTTKQKRARTARARRPLVVVVGGAGFIGSHIVDALIAHKYRVRVIDNLSHGNREYINPHAVFYKVDIRNLRAITPIMKGARYVFHCAALPRVQYSIQHPALTTAVNIGGTANVLIAAVAGGVRRVIYSASSSAYGDQKKMPLLETMEAHPKSPYGLQKYVGELLARVWYTVYGIETVSLRYFNVYGPRLNPEGAYALVIGRFLKQRSSGKSLTIAGDGAQTRDFTHVRDVVRANLLAMKSAKVGQGEVINIGAGRNVSVNALAKLIGGPTMRIPNRLEPRHTRADTTRAKRLLGWQPRVRLEDGIRELKVLFGIKTP